MDSFYSNFSERKNFSRTSSLPLFKTGSVAPKLPFCLTLYSKKEEKPLISRDNLRMIMMEDYIKKLESENNKQNEQINTLMSYQIKNKRRNDLNKSAYFLQPNILLLDTNSILHPINYAKELDRYYSLDRERSKKYFLMLQQLKKDSEKIKKLKEYRREIFLLKKLLKKERIQKKINRNLYNNIVLPIRNDVDNFMYNINNNMKKKIENDNMINNSINEIQNNHEEIKNLFKKRLERLELKQKMEFETFKNMYTNKLTNVEENKLISAMKLKKQMIEDMLNQRELDNMKHQREIDEIKRKYELENIENAKLIDEIRFNNMKNNILNQRNKVPQIIQVNPNPYMYRFPMYKI